VERDRARRSSWVSASDLAESAYCPRAQWYRHHPPSPEAARAVEAAPARRAGVAYHTRTLGAELWYERAGTWPWVVGALGLLLVIAAILAGAGR
jgi:hypothetical protein